ncbi:cysteine hydrolase family protein [Mycolicibacterium tokaiense]|uniref:Isochorismatase hydrolase n=1 Tax=Mycolicibacterium tokaiense TaxID=39695 RepID=A0A378TNI4_9MYCO|nr:isochorismatase family cysteine hydrolase [Mycolicibacterium tokaiense]BBY90193.1 isochorismatase [Mycolicibacterium tokaiense]STZ61423.1 isochorismatase hydrolase [Mycolicibacterium tokaiense]
MTATAVLVIDMLNTYEHPDADKLVPNVEPTVEPLADLIARTRKRDDADLIYVNDNYGDFTADHSGLVASALDGARPDLVKPIVPDENCRFLMKVRHSAFYATSLGYLLNQLDAQRVILTGQVTEQCILYSALDAYVRHFEVVVARDCVAAIDNELGRAALTMMESNMRASIVDAADCLD